MIKPSARWCALIGLLLPVNPAWAGDAATTAREAASAVLQRFGSADSIRQHASLPLTDGNSQLTTIDGAKTASVQITNPSSAAFLSVSLADLATGDLKPVVISQDLNFDGALDYSYQPPFPVSGICANGVISCDPGTWNHCQAYQWQADDRGRASLLKTTMDTLAGCSCVNQSCGGGPGNSQRMLQELGGAVVGVVQGRQNGAIISRVELTEDRIRYFGQNNSGSPTGAVAQSGYAAQPQAISTDAAAEVATQAVAPDSIYSLVTGNFADKGSTTDVQTCSVSRSVSLEEEGLGGIIVPQGGTGGIQICGADCTG